LGSPVINCKVGVILRGTKNSVLDSAVHYNGVTGIIKVVQQAIWFI